MEFLKTGLKGVNKCFSSNYHSVIFTAQKVGRGRKSHRRSDKILLKKKELY